MSPSDEIANWEIFLWALAQLGGDTQFVDIEEVSMECFKIAPARFAWRTRVDLPDYKKCTKALQEAEVRRPSLLVKTGDTFGRQLTAEGQKWIKENTHRLSALLRTDLRVPEPKRRPSSRMLSEIEKSQPFIVWSQTGAIPQEKWRMADVLRCSPDSNPQTWKDRLESARAVAYAANNNTIVRFLTEVAKTHPDWFGG
jgi:hypothetical protein